MTYTAAIRLACLGYGDASAPDLTATQAARIEQDARDLHRLSGWTSPPSPWRLATRAGVMLVALSPESALPNAIGETESLYHARECSRDTGLAATYALAASIMARRRTPWSPVYCWRFAAELLAPAWAIDAQGMDRFAAEHPHAPSWLVTQRQTQRLAAVG